jgi:hypothetical protein
MENQEQTTAVEPITALGGRTDAKRFRPVDLVLAAVAIVSFLLKLSLILMLSPCLSLPLEISDLSIVSYLKLSIKFTSACHVPMVYCCTG